MKTVLAPNAPWPTNTSPTPLVVIDKRRTKARKPGPRNLKEKNLFSELDIFKEARESIANKKRSKK
jgi:hypothetical protein